MRKINELKPDEFFDIMCILFPVIPLIINSECVQAYLFKSFSVGLNKAREQQRINALLAGKEKNEDKKASYEAKISESVQKANEELGNMFSRDLINLLPKIASKEYRHCIYETLAIVEQTSVENIQNYPIAKVTTMIKNFVTDADFTSFLSYAEKSESTELLSTPQNLQGL